MYIGITATGKTESNLRDIIFQYESDCPYYIYLAST